jgi:putative transposase
MEMSRGKHSEAQIIAALKQVEAGRTADDVARECGVSKHTIYAWKAKFGGMEASEAQKLRALEDENGRLKRLVADLTRPVLGARAPTQPVGLVCADQNTFQAALDERTCGYGF